MEKDLFGDRCTEQEDLVHLIKDYAENGFQENRNTPKCAKNILLISITITVSEPTNTSKARLLNPGFHY